MQGGHHWVGQYPFTSTLASFSGAKWICECLSTHSQGAIVFKRLEKCFCCAPSSSAPSSFIQSVPPCCPLVFSFKVPSLSFLNIQLSPSNRHHFTILHTYTWGWDSSGSIATRYGLDGPGIESRWGRDFLHLFRPALGPTQPSIHGVPDLFPWGKGPGAWR